MKNGVKNIQTAGSNGACTEYVIHMSCLPHGFTNYQSMTYKFSKHSVLVFFDKIIWLVKNSELVIRETKWWAAQEKSKFKFYLFNCHSFETDQAKHWEEKS